jgi:hypothetical protein
MPLNLRARVQTMARETKLGLVVSCSFLCLLGVVVALKLAETPEEEPGTDVAAAAPNEAAPSAPHAEPGAHGDAKPQADTPAVRKPDAPAPFPTVSSDVIHLTSGTAAPPAAKPGTNSPPVPPLPPLPAAPGDGSKPVAKGPPTGGSRSPVDVPPLPPIADTPPPAPAVKPAGRDGKGTPPDASAVAKGKAAATSEGGLAASLWGQPAGPGKAPATTPAKTGADGGIGAALARANESSPPPGRGGGAPKPTDAPPPPPVGGAPGAVSGPMVPDSLPALPPSGQQEPRPAASPGGTSGTKPMTVEPLAKPGTTGSNTGATALPELPPVAPLDEKKSPTPDVPALPDLPPTGNPKPAEGESGSQRLRPVPVDSQKGAASPAPAPPPAPPPPPVPPDAGTGTGGVGTAGTGGAGGAGPVKAPEKVPTARIGSVDAGDPEIKGISVGGSAPLVAVPAAPLPPVAPVGPTKNVEPILVGGTSTASVPPLSVAPAAVPTSLTRPARPDVVTYTEATHEAGPGDTFKSISQAKYGTDRYADALYRFNRSHPLAEDDLPEDGSLKPRQKVYVPPAEILENRYPEQIKGAAPAPAPGVTVGASPRSAPAPATYRVGAGGEFQYDIARKQLGDGNRWMEIQKLNPGWDPAIPVPAGTTLKLPSDARQQ